MAKKNLDVRRSQTRNQFPFTDAELWVFKPSPEIKINFQMVYITNQRYHTVPNEMIKWGVDVAYADLLNCSAVAPDVVDHDSRSTFNFKPKWLGKWSLGKLQPLQPIINGIGFFALGFWRKVAHLKSSVLKLTHHLELCLAVPRSTLQRF